VWGILFSLQNSYAQKSSAELLTTVKPPKMNGDVFLKDGIRHIKLYNNYLLISNYWTGLYVYDISDINNPVLKGSVQTDDDAFNSDIDGNHIYFANHSAGIQIYSFPDLNKQTQIKTPGKAIWIDSDYPQLYVALGNDGFAIMEISDPKNPITLALEVPGTWVQHLVKHKELLYVASKKGGLLIYNVENKDRPKFLSKYHTEFDVMMVQVEKNYAYLADGAGGLVILDISNPQRPKEMSRFSTDGYVRKLFKFGNYVYLANESEGLQIVNVENPNMPILEGSYPTESICYDVVKKDIYVFLAANTTSLFLRHNNSPRLEDLADLTIEEGKPFQLQLKAYEPDGDEFYLTASNLPEGGQFDANTGIFSWEPSYDQSGEYEGIVFQATERTISELFVADTIKIMVNHVNRPPDLPALTEKSINENSPITFTIQEGTDPDVEDQGNLSYNVENLPEGANFDATARILTWTPSFEQSGIYVMDFILEDGAGGYDREPITLTVNHVDRKPTINSIAGQLLNENEPVTIQISGFDPDQEDQDKISYKVDYLPEGAVFDEITRTLSWTPSYEQSGYYPQVRTIMMAGNMSDTSIFAIKVNHVNRPPELAQLEDKVVSENKESSFKVEINDPDMEDAGKLTLSVENLPEGASFDPETGLFSWVPNYDQSGNYQNVTFSVSDPSGLTERKEISIQVNHVNRTPQISQVPDKNIQEDNELQIQLSAADPDQEDQGKLSFSSKNLPEGARLDPELGLFRWKPTYEQSGSYSSVFLVSDGQYVDSVSLQIKVEHVNRSPELMAVEEQSADENHLISFTLNANDPDVEDEGKLSLSAQNIPVGATFDPSNQSFSWTPTYEQSGKYSVAFNVIDPNGLSSEKTVDIVVNHVNRPPLLETVAAQSADENQMLTIQLKGSDPDKEDTGKLIYEVSDLPKGAKLFPATGEITWLPSHEQAGQYHLQAIVKDEFGLTSEQPLEIKVNNVNRPPKFVAMANQSGLENSDFNFVLQAEDPDLEDQGTLTYTALNLPLGAKLNSSKGELIWKPTFEQAGDYTLEFEVKDSYGASDHIQSTISIANYNRPPKLNSPGSQTVDETQTLAFNLIGEDPDKEDQGKLTYQVSNLPEGANFDINSGQFSWAPTYKQSGEYIVGFQVTDLNGETASTELMVKISDVNRPPQLSPLANQSIKENESFTISLNASDPDVEDEGKLTFSGKNLPKGAKLNPTTGELSWTPSYEQSGVYNLECEVKDREGATERVQLALNVEHVNRAPSIISQGNQIIKEGEELKFIVTASDPDKEDENKLKLTANFLPEGAEFISETGRFAWKPNESQQGIYDVEFTVTDSGGLGKSMMISIQVEDVPEIVGKP
jgi:hypothetical protein